MDRRTFLPVQDSRIFRSLILFPGTRLDTFRDGRWIMANSKVSAGESLREVNDAIQHIQVMIKQIRIAMLTTVNEEGELRSRPMMTLKLDSGTLWFFSSDHHGKADELSLDPRVNIVYSQVERKQYLSISGLAELIHDENLKRQLWEPEFTEWFPEGVEDRHLALIKVSMKKAEYWDAPSQRIKEVLSFTKAVLTGGLYHPIEPHQSIRFQ